MLEILIYSAITGYLLTKMAIMISEKYGLIDKPSIRKIHKQPIYLGGGWAIFTGWILLTMMFLNTTEKLRWFIVGVSALFMLGMFDDIIDIKPTKKLTGQILSSILILSPLIGRTSLVHLALYVAWLVGITNAFNLIDGIDGLAASLGITSCTTLLIVTHNSNEAKMILIMIGILTGFLILNFHPAKIFMGDSGSNITGMILGYTALNIILSQQPHIVSQGALLFAIFFIPVADTLWAIIRRLMRKKSITQADKNHIHHRLLAIGWSQRRVVLTLSLINVIVGIGGVLLVKA